MKVKIGEQEWYPVYAETSDDDAASITECEVPEETVKRWGHIMEQFNEMQMEMSEAVREATKQG